MRKKVFDTEKIEFEQTRYFSGEIRKFNFRGAQELQTRSGINSRVLDICLALFAFLSLILMLFWAGAVDSQPASNDLSISPQSQDIKPVPEDVPNKGYSCLESKVNNLTKASFEQAIFGVLALGYNKKLIDVIKENKKNNEECWPSEGCKIKETAEVALAYQRAGQSTDGIAKWLESKVATATGLIWNLEIDILEHNSSECSVGYDNLKKNVQILDDMSIGAGAASACFAPSASGYWLQIAEKCVDKNFEISCNKDFLTTLLYEKSSGGTVYVSPETHNAASGAITNEKVQAKCFKTGGECDYEGSLWATLALHKLGKDIKPYVPYLQALTDDNRKYFPSSFIYFVQPVQDQFNEITEQQNSGKFWDIIGSPYRRYYDTSLAILALDRSSNVRTEVEQAKNYLASSQLKDGCWNARDSIIDTAFVLYSAWSRAAGGQDGQLSVSGTFCSSVAGASCESDKDKCLQSGGKELVSYTCLKSREFCCSIKVPEATCADQNGYLCTQNEECSAASLDAFESGVCCSERCSPKQSQNTCPLTASCKSACENDEEEVSGASCGDNRLCCITQTTTEKGTNYFLIILLIVLIILVMLIIIYRHKLQVAWYTWRGKVKSSPVEKPGPSSGAMYGLGPKPIFRPTSGRTIARPVIRPAVRISPKDKEMEETMKKLREMTK